MREPFLFYHEVTTPRRGEPVAPPIVACPDCGSPLNVDEEAIKFDPRRPDAPPVVTRIAFCCGCEFAHEF